MAKSKVDFRHLLIEAFLIVFTVLLALALNEWWSGLKEKKTQEAVISNIVKEIEVNKSELESKMDYHLEMSRKLNTYLSSDSLWSTLTYDSGIGAMIQIMDKGLQNPNLQAGAWRSAELSGIVNSFDFETIYILSTVYQIHEEGPESTWKQLAMLLSEPSSYEQTNAKRLARMLQLGFQELYAQERSLIANYQDALEKLKKR